MQQIILQPGHRLTVEGIECELVQPAVVAVKVLNWTTPIDGEFERVEDDA